MSEQHDESLGEIILHHVTNDLNYKFLDLHLLDRKSTRLNSSHKPISYAVFCLKKKKIIKNKIKKNFPTHPP